MLSKKYRKVNIPIPDNNDYKKYTFCRGFLLSPEPVIVHDNWKQCTLGPFYLTYDPNVEFYTVKENDIIIALVGSFIDLNAESIDIKEIAHNIIIKFSESFDTFVRYLDMVCGRHCIIIGNKDNFQILQDATGMRSVYYHVSRPIVSSHYNLIKDYLGEMEPNPYFSHYQKMNPRPWTLPGDFTPWKDIRQLFANHVLDINNSKIRRFWPIKKHDNLSINYTNEAIFNILQLEVKLLLKKTDIIVSLTSGTDSRLSASLLKSYRNDVVFYSYTSANPKTAKDHDDALEIASNLGLRFISINLDDIDESDPSFSEIKQVTTHNHYHRHAAKTVPIYLEKFPKNVIHLQSNLVEIIREFEMFESLPDRASVKNLVDKIYSMDSHNPMVLEMFNEYYETNQLGDIFNYLTTDIIYWEYRMSGWLNGAVLLESDFAFDTFMLFNCRHILELGLSSPRFYKRNNSIPFNIVRNNWPEMYFKISNSDYDLFDIADSDNSRLEIPHKVRLTSSLDQELYYYPGRYYFEFGYAKNVVSDNSFVSVDFDLPVRCNNHLLIQFETIVSSKSFIPAGLSSLDIRINNESLYSTDLGDYKGLKNIIEISRFNEDCSSLHFSFLIKSHKSFTSVRGCAGHISIKAIRIKYGGSSNLEGKNYVRSTKGWEIRIIEGSFKAPSVNLSVIGSELITEAIGIEKDDRYNVINTISHQDPFLVLQKFKSNLDGEVYKNMLQDQPSPALANLLKDADNENKLKSLIINDFEDRLLCNKTDWVIIDTFFCFSNNLLVVNADTSDYYVHDNLYYLAVDKYYNNRGFESSIVRACPNYSYLLHDLISFIKKNWGKNVIIINSKPCMKRLTMKSGIIDIPFNQSDVDNSDYVFNLLVQNLDCHSIIIPDLPLSRDGFIIHYIFEVLKYIKACMNRYIFDDFLDAETIYKNHIELIKNGDWLDSIVATSYLNHIFDIHDRQSDSEILPIATKLIDQGDPNGYAHLGRAYHYGRGLDKNNILAEKYLQKASDNSIDWATIDLFDLLWNDGRLNELIVNRIQSLADSGNDRAILRIYKIYRFGLIYPKNHQSAARYLKLLLEIKPGDLTLTCEYFDLLLMINTDCSRAEAFNLVFSKDTDDPECIARLAKCYQYGIGTEVNMSKALKLYESVSSVGIKWILEEISKVKKCDIRFF